MSDTKDDGSSKERRGITPVGRYGSSVPRKKPARADFQKWARRDGWDIAECAMLILGFEPFDVSDDFWPKPPAPGFKDIYETLCRSFPLPWGGLTRRMITPPQCLAWAREKEYPIPEQLEETVNRFQPKEFVIWAREKDVTIPDEVRPSTTIALDNEPAARRKAPDTFIAALIRLIAEISKRSAEKGMPFNVTEMPGTKADFRALAIKFDDKLDKAGRTFDDYLAGLVRFKQGARETTYYQELFPEFFRS